MGLNAWLSGVKSYGVAPPSATASQAARTIDGKPGKRISLLRYSITGNVSANTGYVQTSIEQTTGTAATGASSMTVAALTGTIASGDTICYVANNGTYNWAIASANCTSILLGLDTTAAVATAITAGAVYWLGPYNSSNSATIALTAGFVATTGNFEPGCFFGSTKGSPMRLSVNGNTTQWTYIDYAVVGFLDI
jgi:hypothetical protein